MDALGSENPVVLAISLVQSKDSLRLQWLKVRSQKVEAVQGRVLQVPDDPGSCAEVNTTGSADLIGSELPRFHTVPMTERV